MKNGRRKGRARVLEKGGDISMNLDADRQILNLDGERASLNVAADRSKQEKVESSTRIAVLVLGMHRSGTSSVAGALIRLGGAAPLNLEPPQRDNPTGFWESSVLMALNDEILAAGGSYWHDWREFDPKRIDAAATVALRARAKSALFRANSATPALRSSRTLGCVASCRSGVRCFTKLSGPSDRCCR